MQSIPIVTPATLLAKKNAKIAAFVFGVIFTFVSVLIIAYTLGEIPTPIDPADADLSALQNGAVYKIDELYLTDCYAEYGETPNRFSDKISKVETYYYTVLVFDAKDDLYVFSMEAEPSDDIIPAINDYLNDDEQGIGDLVLNGYFTAETNALGGDLLDYYNEAVDLLGEYFDQIPTTVNLVYECAGDADYAAHAASEQNSSRIMGAIFLLIGIGAIALGFVHRKRYAELLAAKEEADKRAAAEAAWNE